MLIKVCSFEVNLEAFIHFLARSEKTNQKRGATPKAPYIGGCNSKIGKTAILTSSKLLTLNRLKASLSSLFANPQF